MTHYQITSSAGVDMGVYEGATAADALDAQDRYWAVAGQDRGTCEALGWAWVSVRPYVVATDAGESEALDAGVAALGHDDVYVYDSEAARG